MTEQEEFEFRLRLEKEREQPATLRQKVQASMPGRVVQGARDSIDAGAQLLPRGLEFVSSLGGYAPNRVSDWFGSEAQRVDAGIAENEKTYEAARRATGSTGFDAARMAGNIISPANAAIASRLPVAISTGGRIVQGAAMGALGGALAPVDTGDGQDYGSTKRTQVALGAAAGGVLTPIMGKVMDFVGQQIAARKTPDPDAIFEKAKQFSAEIGIDWGKASEQEKMALAEKMRAAVTANAGADPLSAVRITDFKKEGIPYLLGQVTRDPTQFALEKNLSQLSGTGAPITERLMQQGAQMRGKINQFGSGAVDEQSAGSVLSKALADYDAKLAKDVTSAYSVARNSAGKDIELPMQGLAQDFAEVLSNFGDKVPSGVRNQFTKYGIAPGGDMTQRKLFTVEEADKLLKVINSNQSNDPATNAALAALRTSVKRAVTEDGGAVDVFAAARKAAASRFALQDAVPALEAAASGRANPDTFVQNFILNKSAQTKQVQQMAALLKEQSPEAFDQARAQIGAYLGRQAFGNNLAGDKGISPERLATALRGIGDAKLGAFFTPAEVDQLNRLSRIAAYMESVPNASKPNTSGNWGAITSLAQKIPGVPASIGIAGALKSGVANQMAVTNALSGKIPAKPTPEEIQLLSRLLSGGALGSGGVIAGELR